MIYLSNESENFNILIRNLCFDTGDKYFSRKILGNTKILLTFLIRTFPNNDFVSDNINHSLRLSDKKSFDNARGTSTHKFTRESFRSYF